MCVCVWRIWIRKLEKGSQVTIQDSQAFLGFPGNQWSGTRLRGWTGPIFPVHASEWNLPLLTLKVNGLEGRKSWKTASSDSDFMPLNFRIKTLCSISDSVVRMHVMTLIQVKEMNEWMCEATLPSPLFLLKIVIYATLLWPDLWMINNALSHPDWMWVIQNRLFVDSKISATGESTRKMYWWASKVWKAEAGGNWRDWSKQRGFSCVLLLHKRLGEMKRKEGIDNSNNNNNNVVLLACCFKFHSSRIQWRKDPCFLSFLSWAWHQSLS